jgi:signal transduction histidine kinase/ligand-binding sensor domain-containing protein
MGGHLADGLSVLVARAFLLSLLLLNLPTPVLATYRFDAWTADHGLPQNIVTGICQTKDGYLWIATLDGLARFDGVRFTVFDKNNSPGLRSHRFGAIFEDANGDLWLWIESGDVTRYRGGRFTTYTTDQGVPGQELVGFTQDEAGRLLIVSTGAVRRYDPSLDRFVEIEWPAFATGYHRLLWDGPGIWGADETSLHLFDRGRWTAHPLPTGIRGRTVTVVARAQDGTFWIETADGRRVTLPTASRVQPRQTAVPAPSTVAYRDARGEKWRMDVHPMLRRSITLPTPGGTERRDFTILFEDREGHVWLGTDGGGLVRARPLAIASYSQPQGLVDRNVYPIVQDRTGDIWIGAWNGGVSRFHEGRFISYTTKDGLAPNAVTALAVDHDGGVWIATAEGLQIWRHGRFETIATLADRFLPIRSRVAVIHHDRAGVAWLGTERGLTRYERGAATQLNVKDGLVNDNVRVIADSARGGLWIGTYGGLGYLEHGKFTNWTQRDGLPGDMIRALYEDADGVLWIGTYDSGLARFHDGKFTHFTTRDGLFNDGVFQILEDGRGNLWMSSNRGISRVSKHALNARAAGDPTPLNAIAYGKDDGMLNIECNGGLWPAGIEARDGTLWFPTQDGVAVIDPASIPVNPKPPPVVIESVLVDRAPMAFEQAGGVVRIGPDATGLEIAYTGLSFLNADRIRFRFKLDGLDREWLDAGTRRTAYYSHLPAGDYVFRVTAANSDGVWNDTGQTLRIIVTPPFYRRAWFVLLMLATVTGAAIVWHHRRLARVRAAHAAQADFSRRLLASQEQERKRIAGELHDSLGQQLLVIRNRAMLGDTVADDPARSRGQFDEIVASATAAIGEVRTIAHNLRPVHLDRLGLTASIEEMVETMASATGLQFSADIEPLDGLLSKDEEITCYRIIQESANNIVKHAEATKAYVEIWRENGELRITVRDNGRGVEGSAARQGGGLGLTSITERLRMLGGSLTIDSATGQGTTLNMQVPLSRRASGGDAPRDRQDQ